MPFTPKFTITAKVAGCLMRIEAAKQAVQDLPITPSVLATLRETAWVDDGFILIADPAKKSRKYRLETNFQAIL